MKFLFWGATIIFLANSKTLMPLILYPNYIYFAFLLHYLNKSYMTQVTNKLHLLYN